MLKFELTKRTDSRLLELMAVHYSQPKGFVGRNLCYAIYFDSIYYGHIVGGSATRFLPGRNEFLVTNIDNLNHIVNNIFYHVEKRNGEYPKRNFTSYILKEWIEIVSKDWETHYGDSVLGFESLIELPRTGDCYKKAGWSCVGETIGYTCKRVSGESTDTYTGKRIWDTKNLRPKLVFCFKPTTISIPRNNLQSSVV